MTTARAAVVTHHPEHYRLVNLDDGSTWRIGEAGRWVRAEDSPGEVALAAAYAEGWHDGYETGMGDAAEGEYVHDGIERGADGRPIVNVIDSL